MLIDKHFYILNKTLDVFFVNISAIKLDSRMYFPKIKVNLSETSLSINWLKFYSKIEFY